MPVIDCSITMVVSSFAATATDDEPNNTLIICCPLGVGEKNYNYVFCLSCFVLAHGGVPRLPRSLVALSPAAGDSSSASVLVVLTSRLARGECVQLCACERACVRPCVRACMCACVRVYFMTPKSPKLVSACLR